MKVKKLVVDYEYDFDLLGISSSSKDFRLAWSINKSLKIRLVRAQDYSLKFDDGKKIIIANYLFDTEHSIFRLFKNKAVEATKASRAYLVPEMTQFDYFATVRGIINLDDTNNVIEKLRKADAIEYVTHVDINKLKSKENFLF